MLTTIEQYEAKTKAIFEAQAIFRDDDVCRLLNSTSGNCQYVNRTLTTSGHHRYKRAFGSYILAGAALGLASASMAFATANRVDEEKLKSYVEANQDQIEKFEKRILLLENRNEVLQDTQNSLLGYVEDLTETVESIAKAVNCHQKIAKMQRWAAHQDRALADLLQFVLQGQTYGRLTPSLIRPDLLKDFIAADSHIDSKVLSSHPNILYQTATANLIRANFIDLQFTFLLSFPRFDKNPVYPYFAIKQLGFRSRLPSDLGVPENKTTCLRFILPDTAVVHNGKLYVLHDKLHCPMYANVMICSNSQFQLYPLDQCLRLNSPAEKQGKINVEGDLVCPIVKCFPDIKHDTYISTAAGIFVHTFASHVSVTYDNPVNVLDMQATAFIVHKNVSEAGTIFIPWLKNISTVNFGLNVVYSPLNANHFAHVTISNESYAIPEITMSDAFGIPGVGAPKLQRIIEDQRERLKALEDKFQPELTTVKDWATSMFSLPMWLKVAIGILGGLILMLIVRHIAQSCGAKCTCQRRNSPQRIPQDNTQYSTMIRLAPQSLYPHCLKIHCL